MVDRVGHDQHPRQRPGQGWVLRLIILLGSLPLLLPDALAVTLTRLVVDTEAVELRSGPGIGHDLLDTLAQYTRVEALETSGGWTKVVVHDGAGQGWVESKTLGRMLTSTTVVADIGYTDGFRFEGSASTHAHTFRFPLPRDTKVHSASLRLAWRASPTLNRLANFRVEIDSLPVETVSLGADDRGHLLIPLPAGRGTDNAVDVTVRAGLPVSDDRCLDERLAVAFLHILPSSGVEIVHDARPASVRDFWTLLPRTVTVSLPEGEMQEKVFAAAWALTEMLKRIGREVRFTEIPELGDIILAPRSAIEGALIAGYPDHYGPGATIPHSVLPSGDENVFLLETPHHMALALTEPFDAIPPYLLHARWHPLGAARGYRLLSVPYPAANAAASWPPGPGKHHQMPLTGFGFDTGPRFIGKRAEWTATLEPGRVPPRTRPARVDLQVVVPVRSTEHGYELYAYLNDVLLRAVRLQSSGMPQSISISLPERHQYPVDALRIVIQHDGVQGDCVGEPATFPIQITPASRLIVERDERDPENFAELARYLSGGFDVYLPNGYLQHPNALHMLARLSTDYPLTVDFARIRFVEGGTPVTPQRPFLAVGDVQIAGFEAPVRFDRGAVRIVDGRGAALLDVGSLPGIAVAQLLRGDSSHGLWVRPTQPEALPRLDGLQLKQDDVAFADHGGIILTIDSTQPSLARIHYPGITDWTAILAEYRFWLLALAWLALTLIAVYLYRKTRKHDAPAVTERLTGDFDDRRRRAGDSSEHL